MSDKKILVKIDPIGRPTIETVGFTGGACKVASQSIVNAFRGAELNEVEKPELHLMETEAESESLHN
jgi:hypothetical protein